MTVESTVNKAQFNGSGSVGPFTFDFRFFANSEIHVIKTSTANVDTDLVETTNYTVAGAGTSTGGSVTLVTALATGETLTIYREIALVQTTSIRNQGAFFPEIHETVFDRLTMMVQQLADAVKRTFKFPVTSAADGPELPLGDYASKLLGFDVDGNAALITPGYSITVVNGTAGSVSPSYHSADSGPVRVDLPVDGEVIVTKTGSTANLVNIYPAGASTINGCDSYSLSVRGESVHLIFNEGVWYSL